MKNYFFKTTIILFNVFFSIYSLHSQIVMVRYMDYNILTSIKVRGYSFCMQETNSVVFTDTVSFNEIDNYFTKFQYVCDTCSTRFPDVRRQIIILYPDESYKVLSYDKFSMELNGKSVIFNKKLHDIIEDAIFRNEQSNKKR